MQPIVVDIRRTATLLGAVAAGLVVVSLIGDAVTLATEQERAVVSKVVRMFDLDEENNVPAFYSTLLIFAASMLLLVIGRIVQRDDGPHWGFWYLLGVIFAGLSFDEYASLHEVLIDPLQNFGGQSIFFFGWVVAGVAFVALMAVVFARFLIALPERTRRDVIVAGAVYVVGVLGIEMVEGVIASSRGEDNWPYVAALTVQEAMEMGGMILFIAALLRHLKDIAPRLAVTFTG